MKGRIRLRADPQAREGEEDPISQQKEKKKEAQARNAAHKYDVPCCVTSHILRTGSQWLGVYLHTSTRSVSLVCDLRGGGDLY